MFLWQVMVQLLWLLLEFGEVSNTCRLIGGRTIRVKEREKMIRSMDRLLGKASAEKFEESIKNRNVLNENPLFSKLMFENKVEFYHWNDRLRWKSHD